MESFIDTIQAGFADPTLGLSTGRVVRIANSFVF
jgi:hypothetical protein